MTPHGLTLSWCGLQAVASTSREPLGKQTSTVLSHGTSLPAAHLALQIQAELNDNDIVKLPALLYESVASVLGQGSFPWKLAIHSHSSTIGPLTVAS